MDNYLIDRETLEQFVDELMRQKPLPASSADELTALREKTIKDLDDEVGTAIFDSLTTEQLEQFNQLADSDEDSPEVFRQFFRDAGVDLQKVISEAVTKFNEKFLGGQNE